MSTNFTPIVENAWSAIISAFPADGFCAAILPANYPAQPWAAILICPWTEDAVSSSSESIIRYLGEVVSGAVDTTSVDGKTVFNFKKNPHGRRSCRVRLKDWDSYIEVSILNSGN